MFDRCDIECQMDCGAFHCYPQRVFHERLQPTNGDAWFGSMLQSLTNSQAPFKRELRLFRTWKSPRLFAYESALCHQAQKMSLTIVRAWNQAAEFRRINFSEANNFLSYEIRSNTTPSIRHSERITTNYPKVKRIYIPVGVIPVFEIDLCGIISCLHQASTWVKRGKQLDHSG